MVILLVGLSRFMVDGYNLKLPARLCEMMKGVVIAKMVAKHTIAYQMAAPTNLSKLSQI